MEIFRLEFSKRFLRGYSIAKRNKSLLDRIDFVLNEIVKGPTTGICNLERLRYASGRRYSRRVDKKNRIVYDVLEKEKVIILIQCLDHYDDD
jgi:toxin YoeB